MKFWIYILGITLFINNAYGQTCTLGDCQNGYSIQEFQNGMKYLGEFKKGERNGQGVMFYSNGSKYVGSWKNNIRHGEGRIYKEDRLVKSGKWEYDKLPQLSYVQNGCLTGDCMNGLGIFLYKDGRKVYGTFENGEIKDFTVCYYPDGSKYIGNWKDQGKHNIGIYYNSNGNIQKGIWKKDDFVVETPHADRVGCINGNCVNGKGTFKYDNHGLYKGYFFTEKADGFGVYHFPDGDIYIGEWKSHQFDGQGTMYYNDGTVLRGTWKSGFFQNIVDEEAMVTGYDFTEKHHVGKIWVLLVGVSDYQQLPNLKYTDDDAFKLNSFFKSPEGGALPDNQITILIDSDATQNKILKELQLMSKKAGEDDLILFYFSGHGFVGSFVPHDYERGGETLIKHNEVVEILKGSKAKSRVVIADACHAGSMNTKSASCESILATYYNAFRKSTGGTVLLLSSKADEISLESQGLRQGLFSHFLLKGLNGKADKNSDDIITVSEVYNYIYSNVRFVTSGTQTPVIHGDFDVNLPLSVVKKH